MSVCCACVLRLLCVSRESVFLSCVVLSGCGLVVRFGGDNIYIYMTVTTPGPLARSRFSPWVRAFVFSLNSIRFCQICVLHVRHEVDKVIRVGVVFGVGLRVVHVHLFLTRDAHSPAGFRI